ncbi:hypothetical protein Hypma_001194 [Hypsizygus marmoreus]|uniref:Uncharacterized protein n=1 Tax=Hypsizygus marmoreus TaxID=39966 RepID=A0A369J6K0_HYPMA|nr:hypothetical protein Hypma_001194 [Hypsizygus marmoreus]
MVIVLSLEQEGPTPRTPGTFSQPLEDVVIASDCFTTCFVTHTAHLGIVNSLATSGDLCDVEHVVIICDDGINRV